MQGSRTAYPLLEPERFVESIQTLKPYATRDGARVQAVMPEIMPGAALFALGDTFFAAINDGRLASVLFSLRSPA